MKYCAPIALMLGLSAVSASDARRLGPLTDQSIPPLRECSCFVYEVGKKAKGLVFVSHDKDEGARVSIDGRDEVVKLKRGSRAWERKDGEPPRYEFIEKNLESTSVLEADIRAYGPYRAEEYKREGSAAKGTITFSGRSGTEVMKVDGECSC